jgi:hypothetical protein
MLEERSLTPELLEAALREVGPGVLASAPDGWVEPRFRLDATAEIFSNKFEATLEDGSVVALSTPDPPRRKLQELRARMYEQGKGTWFTARYVIVRPGRYSVDFDYDDEPDFGMPIDPLTYLNDLKYFPRDDGHISDWLRQRVEEAPCLRRRIRPRSRPCTQRGVPAT